jgi:hypothetical protein
MNRRPFTYAVLQYVHDPVAGEAMNIGVLVFSAEAKYLSSTFEYRYERLSNAFSDFDGDGFKRTLREFDQAVDRFQADLFGSPLAPAKLPLDAGQVARRLWPDQGLSFRSTDPRSGLSRDLTATTADLFSRFVSSQNEKATEERRTDEEVWAAYRSRLSGTLLGRVLQPKKFETSDIEVRFDYTFKIERWHVLLPFSLDFARASSMRRKAAEFLGESVALSENPEIRDGRIYLLLGAPTQASHVKAYEQAKRILNRIPFGHELVDEKDAELVVSTLDGLAREHAAVASQ